MPQVSTVSGRVATVTGAGSGIGRAVAAELATRGCHLALVDLRKANLHATGRFLAPLGVRISLHTVDVADPRQMESLPDAIMAEHPRLDIMINNAGVSLAGPFDSYHLDDLEWIIGVNLWGMLHGCRVVLPLMRRQGSGHIVNMSSDFGLIGLPSKTAYCATKFAIRGFSEALRAELADSGIRVTCVYPGAVDTNLIRTSRAADPTKRDREAQFVAARATPVDAVARQIVRGIERGQARVLIGRDTFLIDALTRLSPRLANALVTRLSKRLPFV